MSVELDTASSLAAKNALWRINLLRLLGVDDLHELVKQTVAGYNNPRVSVRPLHFVSDGRVTLGWETCQASLNMILAPTIGTRRFDVEGKYQEIFVKPTSSAEAEKRRCSCHSMPDGSIDDLRGRILAELTQALYRIKCA